jgi:hypothetical protein
MFTFFAEVHNVCGYDFDKEEAIRRSAQQLMDGINNQREQAKQRADESEKQQIDTGAIIGLSVFAILIFSIMAGTFIAYKKFYVVNYSVLKEAKGKKALLDKQQALLEQKALLSEQKALLAERQSILAERFEKAKSMGFSLDNETKQCPACAETIKLKATICKYCRREFSDEEVQAATRNNVDFFLATHNPEPT